MQRTHERRKKNNKNTKWILTWIYFQAFVYFAPWQRKRERETKKKSMWLFYCVEQGQTFAVYCFCCCMNSLCHCFDDTNKNDTHFYCLIWDVYLWFGCHIMTNGSMIRQWKNSMLRWPHFDFVVEDIDNIFGTACFSLSSDQHRREKNLKYSCLNGCLFAWNGLVWLQKYTFFEWFANYLRHQQLHSSCAHTLHAYESGQLNLIICSPQNKWTAMRASAHTLLLAYIFATRATQCKSEILFPEVWHGVLPIKVSEGRTPDKHMHVCSSVWKFRTNERTAGRTEIILEYMFRSRPHLTKQTVCPIKKFKVVRLTPLAANQIINSKYYAWNEPNQNANIENAIVHKYYAQYSKWLAILFRNLMYSKKMPSNAICTKQN